MTILDELKKSLMYAVDASNTTDSVKTVLRNSINYVIDDPHMQLRSYFERPKLVELIEVQVKSYLDHRQIFGDFDKGVLSICKIIVGVWARENDTPSVA